MGKGSITSTTRGLERSRLGTLARSLPRQKIWGLVSDLLYPPRCGGCDRRDTLFCDDCREQIVPPKKGPHGVRGARSLICAGEFNGPLRTAIHNFKYESDRRLSAPLAGLLYDALQASLAWKSLIASPPSLVPVPLHASKEKARGYNQSFLLAEELAAATSWPIDQSLKRTRQTDSQVGLNMEKRRENVKGAFQWQAEDMPSSVLLIDDVCTTGLTLSECVFALTEAGAERVYVATVARAMDNSQHADL
jgi:competence protein ComFC